MLEINTLVIYNKRFFGGYRSLPIKTRTNARN